MNEPDFPAADAPAPHTWTPIDLVAAGDAPPRPPTLSGIAYPGLRHIILGEPESMKTWLALVLASVEIQHGRTVVYLDFEGNERDMLARLRDLGLTNQQIRGHFVYFRPAEPIGTGGAAADLAQLVATRQPTLVVLDAMIGALALHGLDPDRAVDIEAFHRALVDPLAAHGAAILIVDHVVKNHETRGRWATGSERKIGRVDVALLVETVHPFGRGRTGHARITTSKDRPGYLARPRAADLELNSDPDTGSITWSIRPTSTAGDAATFRPTFLMERVSRYLEEQPEPVSRNAVENGVTGKAPALRAALDTLAAEGYIIETRSGRTRLCASAAPYREAADPAPSPSSPVVPDSSWTNHGSASSRSSRPLIGDEQDEDELDRLLAKHGDLTRDERP